jgi:hypothetical protein
MTFTLTSSKRTALISKVIQLAGLELKPSISAYRKLVGVQIVCQTKGQINETAPYATKMA